VYCGAALPADAVAAAAAATEALEAQARLPAGVGGGLAVASAPAPEVARTLVIVDLAGLDAAKVAAATGVSAYEAAQWARRGSDHLLRIVPRADAGAEAEALTGRGLPVTLVDEDEVRAARPVVVSKGGPAEGGLALRGDEGAVHVGAGDVRLVVKGPIAREYQADAQNPKRTRTAALDAGYRYHLHRRDDPRPVELDPGGFDFGKEAGVTSSVREMAEWMARLFPNAPADDTFRLIPPALAPAESDATAGLRALAGGAPGAVRAVLDNLAQFRFHSGWRAALARRRAG
jgi:hypothetical protein